MRIIYDQGSEFIGFEFQYLLDNFSIEKHPTSVKNPQANAICERMHQTVANSIRTRLHTMPAPQNAQQAAEIVDQALATASHVVRTVIHSTMRISPGALVFHRDMFLDIPLVADLQELQQRRQALIDKNLITANARRLDHDYQPNQEVLKLSFNPSKLEPRAEGPYRITTVHTNGTVTIQLNPHVQERINICRIKPFRR